MKIAVRLDDITPDMDWERFLKCKALLDRYQVKPLIGVVPDNRDENLKKEAECVEGKPADFWTYVKALQKEGWEVAMHGYRHIYTTNHGGLFPLNQFSEFAGVPFSEQKRMLEDGRKMLAEKGIDTDIFMAPAHSYDKNTLKALKETGFKALTDGFGNKPYLWADLTFYPISFRLSNTLKKKHGYSTMVIHPGTVTDEELVQYENYFKRESIQWIPYKEYREQTAERRLAFGMMKEFFLAKIKYLLVKIR